MSDLLTEYGCKLQGMIVTVQNARYIQGINFVLLVGNISVNMNVQNDLRNSETRWPGLWKAITPVNNYKTLAKYTRGRVGISYEFKP